MFVPAKPRVLKYNVARRGSDRMSAGSGVGAKAEVVAVAAWRLAKLASLKAAVRAEGA